MANHKTVFTKEQLELLQQLIYENVSYAEMARHFNRSYKTIIRIIKDNNLDMTNYDPSQKPGPRNVELSAEQIAFIGNAFKEGKGKGTIARELGISRNTLAVKLHQYNIDITDYKKKGSQTKHFTEEQLEALQKMLDDGEMYNTIAQKFNINRNTIKDVIARYNLRAKQDVHFNTPFDSKQVKALREIAQKNISLAKIALCFGRGQKFIEGELKKNHIELAYDGQKMDTDELLECVSIAIKANGESIGRDQLSIEDLDKIPELIKKMHFSDMCETLNKSPKAVKRVMQACLMDELLWLDSVFDYEYGQLLKDDLLNPELTNTFLSKKYGVSTTVITKYRNEFGSRDSRTDAHLCKSAAEIDFEEILKTLDLAYLYHKNVLGFEADYYLGQKLVVEVQGDYWHTKDQQRIDADNNKKVTLESKGYVVLQIWEKDINKSPRKVADNVMSTYLKQLIVKCSAKSA